MVFLYRGWRYNPATENALLQQIAQSHTAAAIDAKILRYMAYGEEILVQLPPLPDDLTEGEPIRFKNGVYPAPSISIYPNPASQYLQINTNLPDKTPTTIQIYDVLGKLKLELPIQENGEMLLNTSKWANGLYFYRLIQNGKTLISNKLMVVQH